MADTKLFDEEDDLASVDAALRAALTSRLRSSAGGGSPWGNAIRGMGDTLINSMNKNELERKKAALIQQKKAKLEEGLQALPEEFRGIAKLDLKTALTAAMQEKERVRKLKEWESLGGAGGADLSSMSAEELLKLKRHPTKEIADAAEAALKFYHEGQNPAHSVRRVPGGGMSQIPGALEALASRNLSEQENAASLDIVEIPIGGGKTRRMSRIEAARRLGGGGAPARVLPSTISALGGGQQQPSGIERIPPEVQQKREDIRLKILSEELRQAIQSGDQEAMASIAQEMNLMQKPRTRSGDVAQMKVGVSNIPNAVSQTSDELFGISDPSGTKFREEAATSGRKQVEKLQELKVSTEQALGTLDRLSDLNQSNKIIGGPLPGVKLTILRGIQNLTGQEMGGVPETEEYLKETLSQLKDQLKAFGSGTGISNLDLLTAEKMLAQPMNTQEGRQRIITFMKGLSQTAQKNAASQESFFGENRSLDGWVAKRYGPDGKEVQGSQMEGSYPEARFNPKDPSRQDPAIKEANELTFGKVLKEKYDTATDDLSGVYRGMFLFGGEPKSEAEEVGDVFTKTVGTIASMAVPIAAVTGLTVTAVKAMLSTSAGKMALSKLMYGAGLGGGGAAAYQMFREDK